MFPALRSVAMPRWLVVVLVWFLVLGHVCELPTFTALVRSSHAATHDSHPHDHSGTPQMSCESVDVVVTTGHIGLTPILGVAWTVSAADPVPAGIASAPRDGSTRPPDRLPLFLLHASLLI
jgi:hypothetical protein